MKNLSVDQSEGIILHLFFISYFYNQLAKWARAEVHILSALLHHFSTSLWNE